MLVKSNFHKVRQLGCGRPVYQVKYKRMRGDGFLDIIKGLFTGGAKLLGNLFRSSGAKQLAQKALSSGVELAKETAKEGVKSLAKDVASDPIKYVNKATELVDKLKSSENPQQVAKQEAQAFAKDILKIAKEKVVQPTIDQYRDDYEAAGIPMLPVVASIKNVQIQMWLHTTGMVLTSLAVVWSQHFALWIWIATILLALGFSQQLIKLNSHESEKSAAKLFQWSITYLSIYSLLLVAGVFL